MRRSPGRLFNQQPLIAFFLRPQRLIRPGTTLDQQLRRPRQGQSRRAAPSAVQPLGQQPDRTGRHQIPGGVIQRLQGQGRRFVRLLPVHAGFGYAAAHLYQAVEAAAVLPRAAPAVGVQADVDQPGSQ
ncbi:hypothetical protein D3C85_1453450 [compost metagenome]